MKFPGTRLLARIMLAFVAAVALAVAVTGCSMFEDAGKSDTAKSEVGDCINVISSSAMESETEPVDCSSEKAVYKVVETHETKAECAEGYTSFEETLGGGTTAFLCLAPNYKEGSCYSQPANTGAKLVDCTSSDATFKVVKRIDGETDELLCAGGATQFITIPDPKTTFCLGDPKA